MKILSLTLLACISLPLFAQEEKVIDGRVFSIENDVWVEQALNPIETATHVNVTFGDEKWQEWYRNPALKPVLDLGANVVFAHDGYIHTVSSSGDQVKFVSLLAPTSGSGAFVSSEATTVGALLVSSAKVGQGSTSTPNNPGFPTLLSQ